MLAQHLVSIDLTPFVGVEDPEAISEDGISVLMKNSCDLAKKGWEFQDCHRSERSPGIFVVEYTKDG